MATLAVLAIAGPPVAAQEIDEGTRASARQLGDEAGEAYARGDFAAALDAYRRADALVHLPTLSLRVARCLERLGRFLEAAELYVAVTRMDVGRDPRGVQAEAKAQADAEHAALLPRIPALVIEVAGESSEVTVTLDGKPVPAALLGARRLVDPGAHTVVAATRAARATREIEVKAGETLPVKLELAPAAPVPAVSKGTPPVAPPVVDAPAGGSTSPRRVAAFVVGGVGVATVVVGAITGGLVFAQKGAIDAGCVAKGAAFQCNAAGKSAADRADALALVSSVTLPVGLSSALVGTILLGTESHATTRPATGSLVPFVTLPADGSRGVVLGLGGAL